MSQPGVSSSWATLQSAAFQVAEEEKSTSYEGLMFVADQIAEEQGFPSPYRKKKDNNSTAPTPSLEARRVSPRLTAAEPLVVNLKANKTESDADALLKEMNFTPRVAPAVANTVTFDDVDALLKMSRPEEEQEDNRHNGHDDDYHRHNHNNNNRLSSQSQSIGSLDRNRRSRDRYLSRLSNRQSQSQSQQSHNSSSVSFTNNSSRPASVSSQPAALARALQAMDRRDPMALRDRLQLTDLQASLLLSMQQIKKNDGSSSGRSKAAQSKTSASSSLYSNSRKEEAKGSQGHSGQQGQGNGNGKGNGNGNGNGHNMERIEQLSLPRPTGPSAMDLKFDPTLRHGLLEEAEHCTFKPSLAAATAGGKGKGNHSNYNKQAKKSSKRTSSNNNDSDDEDDLSPAQIKEKEKRRLEMFLLRQEGDERARRESLQYEQGRLNFESRLDRKQCPSCGAKQSYDEFKEKRKVCPACELEYRPALTWGSIASSFLRKVKHCEQDKQRRLDQLRQELIASSQPCHEGDKQQRKMAREQLEEFLSRLDEAMARREMRLQQIAMEAGRELTFQPNARTDEQRARDKASRKKGDGGGMMEESDDDDMSALSVDPVRDFLLRYEEDMARRKESMPQRFGERHAYDPNEHKRHGGPGDDINNSNGKGGRRFKF